MTDTRAGRCQICDVPLQSRRALARGACSTCWREAKEPEERNSRLRLIAESMCFVCLGPICNDDISGLGVLYPELRIFTHQGRCAARVDAEGRGERGRFRAVSETLARLRAGWLTDVRTANLLRELEALEQRP